MSAIVEVKLELGHRAKVRDVPSLEGHTHDWVVFVKGTDKIRLEYFVERVVFWLHESYEQHRRVIKTPPYKVEQSGFAGFNMLIDVHFRNREEPKMVRFQYDLFLHTEAMPPVNHTRLEKLTFTNPTEDFRKKLVDAGAMLINNPLPKHSRDHSKERTSISPSMKERSKSRDSSKRRDNSQSSSSRSSDDKKRPSSSSSSHVGKKDGRIPGKDMKKHEDAFKHPKPPEVSVKSSHKDSPSGEKERGRAEKRRSIADDDGSKKKKKRHSDDVPSPSSGSSQSRPKSLPVSTKQQNPPPKKEKPKKIREKTDIMAGLFAPENSINMTQIKQSKEKSKSESSDVRLSKKEKRSNVTPSRKSVSPHPNQEEVNVVQSTKISPTGNITLKIKKERITSAEKEKKESKSLNESVKVKKKDPEKQKSKLSPIESTKVKRETIKVKEVKKRSPSTSSDTSSSSSSPSDMDISSDSDSGDAVVTHKTKILHKSKKESEKHESKSKITTSHREKITEKQPEKPTLNSSRGSKFEKIKAEKNSPAHSSDKVKVKVEKRAEKMSSSFNTSGKERKLSVGDNTTLDKSRDTSTTSEHRKSRKQKRSSKEKAPRKSSETKTSTPNVVKKEKQRSTPNSSSQNLDRFSSSKKEYQNSPGDYSSMSPVQSSKSTPKSPKKLSNSSLLSTEKKEKERNKKSFNTEKKMKPQTKKQPSKSTSKVEDRPKPVYKSRSFVETSSSDSDDEIRPPAEVMNSMVETPGYPRKDSVSSQSSTSSSSSARSHQEETKPLVPIPDPMDKVDSPVSSSSTDTSSDDDIEMSEIPKNTSTMSVLSPIRDDAPSIVGKTLDSTAPFGNMSESTDNDDNSLTGQQSPTDMNRSFHPLHDDALSSSEEEDQSSPPETPFQNLVQTPEMSKAVEEEKPPSQPNVIILTGQDGHYPHMTESLYRELQDLQKRISYVTDVERLRKIARIVAKSQKLLKNDDYFDFDLCSLDNRTIHKIQKQLEAV